MKANYFKVGVFVLVAMTLFVTGVVVLGAGLIGREEIRFETYFNESVSGLTVGSAVELRGVRVGEVTKIGFVSDMSSYYPREPRERTGAGRIVRVVFAVFPESSRNMSKQEYIARWERGVTRGLRVRLSSNIITGQAVLEGTYVDPNRYSPMKIDWKPEYPYVPSVPSELRTLKDSVDDILRKMQELDVTGVVTATKSLLVSLNTAVGDANVPAITAEIQALLTEARQTNHDLHELLKGPPDLVAHNIPRVVIHLDEVLKRLDILLATQSPQVDLVLANLLEVSANLKELTEILKAQPSQLLNSTPPPRTEAFK